MKICTISVVLVANQCISVAHVVGSYFTENTCHILSANRIIKKMKPIKLSPELILLSLRVACQKVY